MLTGASVHIGGDWESAGERDSDGKARILETIREANIVVATAGAFEHAMMKVKLTDIHASPVLCVHILCGSKWRGGGDGGVLRVNDRTGTRAVYHH